MLIIGDVHGKIYEYLKIIEDPKCHGSIQIGDMGIGFFRSIPNFQIAHRWFRGNHDNPKLARKHSNYLNDWGNIRFKDHDNNIFYVAGGRSIDKQYRIQGKTWWHDEELNNDQFMLAHVAFKDLKPSIMLTHECPKEVSIEMYSGNNPYGFSKTEQALQAMFDLFKPDRWIFGHHHKSWTKKIKGTEFICLDELETMEAFK